MLITRAGSLSIFQFWFDSVRLSISSTRFQFFTFCICTPPQCKSIQVCENTKTELINFDKKFQLKYNDRSRRRRQVWTSFWWKVLHTWHGRSICRSVTAVSPSRLNWWRCHLGWGLRMAQRITHHYVRFQHSHITAMQKYPSVWKH